MFGMVQCGEQLRFAVEALYAIRIACEPNRQDLEGHAVQPGVPGSIHLPQSGPGRVMYAHFLIALGRMAEGIAQLTQALEIDPMSVETNAWVGDQLFFARRYTDALGQLRRAIELDPEHPFTLLFLGALYRHQGLHQQATGCLERAVAVSNRDQAYLAQLGYSYGAAGRTADAQRVLEELEQIGASRYLDPTNMAFVHIGLGDADRAIDWLEKAYAYRTGWMVWLNTCPMFDPLRTHPRFQHLVRGVGIADAGEATRGSPQAGPVAPAAMGARVQERSEASIAVLPFANRSPDPEQEHFSDGLADEIFGSGPLRPALAGMMNLSGGVAPPPHPGRPVD